MKRLAIICSVLLLAAAAIPAFAVTSVKTDGAVTGGGGSGNGMRSNDCPGFVVWDTGMYDDFAPPTGCSSSASAQCIVNAQNPYGYPGDGRRLADDFIADGRPIDMIKIWGRYNAGGYNLIIANPSALHGFCVKIYKPRADQQPIWCPDGTMPGEDAIGDIVYSEYVSSFVPYELPAPALARSFNYCMTLPVPFQPVAGQAYWISVSADFDLVLDSVSGTLTQWFWRLYQGYWEPYCEASWWDTWSGTEVPWQPVSVGVAMPCWEGWNASFVLYSNSEHATGACCDPGTGNCTVTAQSDCTGNWLGGGTVCDPNPCPQPPGACCDANGNCTMTNQADCGGTWVGGPCDPNPCTVVPTKESTWGQIKHQYR